MQLPLCQRLSSHCPPHAHSAVPVAAARHKRVANRVRIETQHCAGVGLPRGDLVPAVDVPRMDTAVLSAGDDEGIARRCTCTGVCTCASIGNGARSTSSCIAASICS